MSQEGVLFLNVTISLWISFQLLKGPPATSSRTSPLFHQMHA